MRLGFIAILASVALCSTTDRACGEPSGEVKKILDRAVTAAGGAEKLAGIKTLTGKGTGTYHGGLLPLGFSASGSIQLPAQKRMELDFGVDGFRVAHIQVLNGNKGWIKERGRTNPMNADQLATAEADMYVNQLMTLVPMRAASYHLTALGPSEVNGRATQGIRVRHDGRPDVTLYFDQESGLLRKATVNVNDGLVQDYYFGNYQDVDGLQRAMKQSVRQNGKAFLDINYSDAQINQEMDPEEFAKP